MEDDRSTRRPLNAPDVPIGPIIKTDTDADLSPLEQIRHAEAEVTRRVASARQAAERTLVKARTQAAQQRNQAQKEGQSEGQAQYQASIASAEEEARQILDQAQKQADALLLRGQAHLYAAVCQAVEFIIGVGGDRN